MPGKPGPKRKKPAKSPAPSAWLGLVSGHAALLLPVFLFVASLSAYTLNGTALLANDAHANMLFSLNMLKHRALSLEPQQAPVDFRWRWTPPGGEERSVRIRQWNSDLDAPYRNGELRESPPYYMVPSVHPGRYVNTFGIGAALTLLPAYAVLNLFTDLAANRTVWYYGAKAMASVLVAGAVVLIFLTMRRFAVAPLPAALGALTFGLGTCAWSVSSQVLWQQTSSLFFLALGAWCLAGIAARPRLAGYCGAALGMAVLCRPTAAIAAVMVGLYLLYVALGPGALSRSGEGEGRAGLTLRPLLLYALGGLPFALLLGAYNAYYLGGPFASGQLLAAQQNVMIAKGFDSIWQTPLAEGLAGVLFSPSRGLFVYSPVLVFGLVGAVMAWKSPRTFALLLPLQAAVLLEFVVSAKHFDWWGGWTYGPRRLVDSGVFLTLLMIPVMARVVRVRWMGAVFAVLLLYSVSVQVIGAWSYYLGGWEYQGKMDIDKPEHRSRLWSWSDNQIAFHATHFEESIDTRKRIMETHLQVEEPVIAGPRRP